MRISTYFSVLFIVLGVNLFGESNDTLGSQKWISNYESSTIWLNGNSARDSKGNKYLISGFGVHKSLLELLKRSPGAESDLIGYEKNHKTGMIVYWTGLGLMIGDIVWGLIDPKSAMQNIGVYAGIGGGGFIIALISLPRIYKANDHLMKAIWHYNKDATFERLMGPKVSVKAIPSFNIASYSWVF